MLMGWIESKNGFTRICVWLTYSRFGRSTVIFVYKYQRNNESIFHLTLIQRYHFLEYSPYALIWLLVRAFYTYHIISYRIIYLFT